MRGHSTMDCTKVWRQYITVKPKIVKAFVVCCFYCGSSEHFGDFCAKRDKSYHPPSAFDFDHDEILDMKDIVEKANKRTGNSYRDTRFGGETGVSKKQYSNSKRESMGSGRPSKVSQSPSSKQKKRRQTLN
jgi:hypothetical protein